AFAGTCGHGTERMTGSAPGPAKVATRMVLLRMDCSELPSYHASLSRHWARIRAPSGQPSIVTGTRPVAPVPPRHARECIRDVLAGREGEHGAPSRFLFLLRQHPLLSIGHAHRRACFRGRRRGALATVQSARNLDRAEQYRIHKKRREDEL